MFLCEVNQCLSLFTHTLNLNPVENLKVFGSFLWELEHAKLEDELRSTIDNNCAGGVEKNRTIYNTKY